MTAFAEEALIEASLGYERWMMAYERLRVGAARLIGASPREIAIVKNTSEGIATVQMGIDWRPGDRVVAFREEFPANYFPWQLLETKGVEIVWRSIDDPLDAIDEACQGARLLAISFVNYLTGHRVDLAAIGEICRRRGVFFFVDAIQGLGVFPIDVESMHIDALAADGHKWLTGPEGCGILYVRHSRLDEIRPAEFGWTNVAAYEDYASRDLTLRSDAGRYECGTLNTIGCFGLLAAIEFLLETGIPAIGPAVLDRAEQLARGVSALGYELIRPWDRDSGAGIVTFRRPDTDARMTVRALKDQSIIAAPRQGWVRMSPHFYQTAAEMDRVLDALRHQL